MYAGTTKIAITKTALQKAHGRYTQGEELAFGINFVEAKRYTRAIASGL